MVPENSAYMCKLVRERVGPPAPSCTGVPCSSSKGMSKKRPAARCVDVPSEKDCMGLKFVMLERAAEAELRRKRKNFLTPKRVPRSVAELSPFLMSKSACRMRLSEQEKDHFDLKTEEEPAVFSGTGSASETEITTEINTLMQNDMDIMDMMDMHGSDMPEGTKDTDADSASEVASEVDYWEEEQATEGIAEVEPKGEPQAKVQAKYAADHPVFTQFTQTQGLATEEDDTEYADHINCGDEDCASLRSDSTGGYPPCYGSGDESLQF